MNYKQRIVELVKSDECRMRALRAVETLDLPDWLIAAGFVRNLIWENLFAKKHRSQDIDVIYFCPIDSSEKRDAYLERQLYALEPNLPWSVKNQARMHIQNGDAPYQNTLDAMRFWPEKQTCIGVMLDNNGLVVVRHCFDLSLQFSGNIDHNAARSIETFKKRIISKGWLTTWPLLQVKT